MKKYFLILFLLPCLLNTACKSATQNTTQSQSQDNFSDKSCELKYDGSDREEVKLRPPGLSYEKANGGNVLTVSDWFSMLCGRRYESLLRDKFPQDAAHESEHLFVKIKAHILLVKSEEDNDYHIQVAERPEWSTSNPQIIVEIPPGASYCLARQNFEALLLADGGRVSNKETGDRRTQVSKRYFFKNPPLAEISGYLFLDAHHRRKDSADLCKSDGGRGVKGKENGQSLQDSPVQGLWEIHPVLELKSAK